MRQGKAAATQRLHDRIWDAASAKDIVVLRGHGGSVESAAFNPDGSRIVTASSDKTARIWDAATAPTDSMGSSPCSCFE
jgi:WD40 repeat protein